MKTHNFEQGTLEWFAVRLGKFTASDAQAIGNNGAGLETLVFEKAAEILTKKKEDSYTNDDTERGNEYEQMARSVYELETGNLVATVGFVELNQFAGCSPDGLVGEEGLVEIKCPKNTIYLRYIDSGKINPAYVWQMQMQLWVTGRKWVDFIVFNSNFEQPIVIKRIERNESDIAKIAVGVETGTARLQAILSKVKPLV